MLSIRKNGNAIMASAVRRIVHFCFNGIALSLTKSSKYFLYSFVPLNQRSNLSDPFTKKKAANRNNGVVGNIGKIIPMIPNPTNKNPRSI